MLKGIGILMAAYGAYAMLTGTVYGKSRWSWEAIEKKDAPFHFWATCGGYVLCGSLIAFT